MGDETDCFDCAVVGTGFGGAVTAHALAIAGFSVCLFERGRRFDPQTFPSLPQTPAMPLEGKDWFWNLDRGLIDIRHLGDLVVAQAAGYGGGSLIYANVHLRAPPEIFAQWPGGLTRAELDPYYDLVGEALDVAPFTDAVNLCSPGAAGGDLLRSSSLLSKARGLEAAAARFPVFAPPLAVRFDDGTPRADHDPDRSGRRRGTCTGCGRCFLGCREGAKNTLDFNYLARMEDTGRVDVRTQAEIDVVLRAPDGYLVRYVDHLFHRPREVRARRVFLCAGSVNTTEILLRSRRAGLDGVDPTLGQGYFPNADGLGMVFDTSEPQEPSRGPTITTAALVAPAGSPRGAGEGSWLLVQDGGYPQALADLLASLFRSPLLLHRNRFREGAAADARLDDPLLAAGFAAGGPDLRPDMPPSLATMAHGLVMALGEPALSRRLPVQFTDALDGFLAASKKAREHELRAIIRGIKAALVRRWTRGLVRLLPWPFWWRRRATVKALHRWLIRCGERVFGFTDAAVLGWTRGVFAQRYDLDDPGRLVRRLVGWVRGEGIAPEDHWAKPRERPRQHRTLLLAMGRDTRPARLVERRVPATDRIAIEVELDPLSHGKDARPAPHEIGEMALREVAEAMGGELRTSPLWAFGGVPVSSHSLGGCAVSEDGQPGVCDRWGEVRGSPGLFVNDGALMPVSLGVNPSATIAAVAERNIEHHIRGFLASEPERLARFERIQRDRLIRARRWRERMEARGVALGPPTGETAAPRARPVGLAFQESMHGHHWPLTDDIARRTFRWPVTPADEETFLRAEVAGSRAHLTCAFRIDAQADSLRDLLATDGYPVQIAGEIEMAWNPSQPPIRYPAAGTMRILHAADTPRGARRFDYDLTFPTDSPTHRLRGTKLIEPRPGGGVWTDTSTLLVAITDLATERLLSRGVLRITADEYLSALIPSLRITGTSDPAQIIWGLTQFARFFLGSLQDVYAPALSRILERMRGATPRAPSYASEPSAPDAAVSRESGLG